MVKHPPFHFNSLVGLGQIYISGAYLPVIFCLGVVMPKFPLYIQLPVCFSPRVECTQLYLNESRIKFASESIACSSPGFTAFKPIKESLGKLKGIDLSGNYGVAFDTKLDSRLSESAAKFIKKELSNLGLRIIAPRESAIVFALKERCSITSARLEEGEEERFEKIGTQLGTALAAKGRRVPT